MDNKTKVVIIGIFLAGTAVGYFIRAPQVSALEYQVDVLKNEISSLNSVIGELGQQIEEISQSCITKTSLYTRAWKVYDNPIWLVTLYGNFSD